MLSDDGGGIMRSSESRVEVEVSRSKRVGLGAGHQPGGVPATPSRAGPWLTRGDCQEREREFRFEPRVFSWYNSGKSQVSLAER